VFEVWHNESFIPTQDASRHVTSRHVILALAEFDAIHLHTQDTLLRGEYKTRCNSMNKMKQNEHDSTAQQHEQDNLDNRVSTRQAHRHKEVYALPGSEPIAALFILASRANASKSTVRRLGTFDFAAVWSEHI